MKKEKELKLIDNFGRTDLIILGRGTTLIKIEGIAKYRVAVIWRNKRRNE